jgi:hypothetical protein
MEVSRRRREHNLATTNTADHPATAITGLMARFWDAALKLTSARRQSACSARLHAHAV